MEYLIGPQTCFSTNINFGDTLQLPAIISQGIASTIILINNLSDFRTLPIVHFDQLDELHFHLYELRDYVKQLTEKIQNEYPNSSLSMAQLRERHRTLTKFSRDIGTLYDDAEVLLNDFWRLHAHVGDVARNTNYFNVFTQDLESFIGPHRSFIEELRRLENLLEEHYPYMQLLELQWWEMP